MSTLRTNALEGVDAKNSITIVAGAGNITTTNVHEGLAKLWANVDGTGTSAMDDSFNASSHTDIGTGEFSVTTTNAFNNSDHSAHVSGNSSHVFLNNTNLTTTNIRLAVVASDGSTLQDCDPVTFTSHGDLA